MSRAREAPGGAAAPTGRRLFIAGLGVGQIVSWGSLYYSFPLIAGPMGQELGISRPEVYAAASIGLVASSIAAFPVGAAMDRGRGRAIMALGSLAAGLLLIGWSRVHGLLALYLVFVGIGLVQAMILYEAAFAVAARRYGAEARRGITALTLWGGFASTVFVPLIQLLLDHSGWRGALVVLGLLNLGLCVALHLLVIDPGRDAPPATTGPAALVGRAAVRWAMRQPAFWCLMVALTAYFGSFLAISFHLYPLLVERGFRPASIVGAIAIIGPAQVMGRIATSLLASRLSVRRIGVVNVLGFPIAFTILLLAPASGVALVAFALIMGAANGIMTIIRALAVHEMLTPDAYGAINGALAVPSMIAQAAAPLAGALLWAAFGSYDAVLIACILLSLVSVAAFWLAAAHAPRKG